MMNVLKKGMTQKFIFCKDLFASIVERKVKSDVEGALEATFIYFVVDFMSNFLLEKLIFHICI